MPARFVGIDLLVIEILRAFERHGRIRCGQSRQAHLAINFDLRVQHGQQRFDSGDIFNEAGDDKRSAVGPRDELGGDGLSAVEQTANRVG